MDRCNLRKAVGTYRNGRVDLEGPVNWPDGERVTVTPEEVGHGLREEDWPTTPKGIADLLAQMDAIEPLELTPAERADIGAFRAAVREQSVEAVRRRMERER